LSEHDIHESVATIDNGRFGSRTIRFETGRLANQAAGAAVAYLGDTMLLSATTAGKHPKEQFDFFPLTVDVEERMYAAGRIPGSFFRREGRPSEDAILTCRLIDRPLRPTFVKGLRNEVQVVITVLSLDPDHLYDVVAINAASMSTQLSGLPFDGPIGATRIALVEGEWVAFPTHTELETAVFDMVVAGRVAEDGEVAIMMVEAEATKNAIELVAGGATAPTEEIVSQGLEAAKPFIAELCRAQREMAAAAAKETMVFPQFLDYQDDVLAAVTAQATDAVATALTIADKLERESELDRIKDEAKSALSAQFEGREKEISGAFRAVTKKSVRQRILRDKVRIDGRGLADIRPLSAEVEVVPRVHGSALFERGETQIRIWVSPRSNRAEPCTRGTTSTSADSGRMSASPRPSMRTLSRRMRWRTDFLVTARNAPLISFSRPSNCAERALFASSLIRSSSLSRSSLSAIVSAVATASVA